jgi:hypothetical protein
MTDVVKIAKARLDALGGGSVMVLLWLMLLAGICGLAIDTVIGFRARTMSQATPEATAMATSFSNSGVGVKLSASSLSGSLFSPQ